MTKNMCNKNKIDKPLARHSRKRREKKQNKK